ncbi:MAG: methylisocitrate lyase [candidate division WOR-3 bacterium]
MRESPGKLFRAALLSERPLKLPGAINAYAAILAERIGFKAIYLSGSGVATASYGLPDLGMTNLSDVLEDVRRITSACSLPLLVDVDTGWGNALGIARTIKEMEKAGAAGVHIEDQVSAKRCGHRPGKEIVSREEMVDRIKAAVDARQDPDFVIMARTDAFAKEGLEGVIERAVAYRDAGADMIFPEALTELDHYRKLAEAVEVPILANITEFGRTPLFTAQELGEAGVSIALYPLSAFRAMAKAAQRVYEAILKDGTQKGVLGLMQTRDELYEVIGYHEYEQRMDELLRRG